MKEYIKLEVLAGERLPTDIVRLSYPGDHEDFAEEIRQAGISAAPEPISATGSGSRADNIKDPAKMTQKEYEARRRKNGARW